MLEWKFLPFVPLSVHAKNCLWLYTGPDHSPKPRSMGSRISTLRAIVYTTLSRGYLGSGADTVARLQSLHTHGVSSLMFAQNYVAIRCPPCGMAVTLSSAVAMAAAFRLALLLRFIRLRLQNIVEISAQGWNICYSPWSRLP